MLDDRQAQTSPAHFPRTGLVDSVKPFEDALMIFGGDSTAGILHQNDNLVGLRVPTERDLPLTGRIFQRVVDEIDENGPQALGIGIHE